MCASKSGPWRPREGTRDSARGDRAQETGTRGAACGNVQPPTCRGVHRLAKHPLSRPSAAPPWSLSLSRANLRTSPAGLLAFVCVLRPCPVQLPLQGPSLAHPSRLHRAPSSGNSWHSTTKVSAEATRLTMLRVRAAHAHAIRSWTKLSVRGTGSLPAPSVCGHGQQPLKGGHVISGQGLSECRQSSLSISEGSFFLGTFLISPLGHTPL